MDWTYSRQIFLWVFFYAAMIAVRDNCPQYLFRIEAIHFGNPVLPTIYLYICMYFCVGVFLNYEFFFQSSSICSREKV